ncbi:hydantoinase/oxoprolinase family protein [Reyranella soli]|uniref:Methylhydantoinase n=1 Tax=Reyranella soli TaxID=1230389 RepID=A0A512NJ36_9HYPH|nr:hydantoinase/oxoprolinase family protein [Reyranella soli]GEP58925.1 methylhydantoinase [Reyranella soli]
MFRIGTDIGGTFTDFVVIDDRTRSLRLEKTLTTPHDPSEGIFEGLALLAEQTGTLLPDAAKLVHGTTLVINALIEQKGVKTALLTTVGFRDVIEMRNELRYDVYDLQIDYPKPLVPRALRFEVAERTLVDGRVQTAPDPSEIQAIAAMLRAAGVRSVAVCFLHAYANATNERAVARVLAEHAPELAVSLSSDVLPQIKEYERTSTTTANAYVKPVVAKYLQRITDGLAERGFGGDFYVMQSGGGVVATGVAQEFPIKILESGPAGGVAAARWWGDLLGIRDLLCFDMGGTTAKLCTIARGEALVTDEYEAARVYRFKRGSGFAISVPVFDLLEIGTGGGSIARIDHLGLVKVGPHSAGAMPGPASYGRGGTEPTVTDADLVLGYLDPDYFLGGSMKLHTDKAEAAVKSGVADRLAGMKTVDAAHGIHEIANEDMASAARLHLAERGEDVGALTMIAYGGAGPVHAYGLARKLGIKRLIVPPAAGVMSALGMLVEDLAIERARTVKAAVATLDMDGLARVLEELGTEARTLLNAPAGNVEFATVVEMRYRGQGYNVRIALPTGSAPPKPERSSLVEQFETHYRQQYGRVYTDVEIELVNVRVVARLQPEHRFEPQLVPPAKSDVLEARKGSRRAYFGKDGMHDCPVFDRYRLGAGHVYKGAAFVEERETTTLIGPAGGFSVNEYGMLVVDVA